MYFREWLEDVKHDVDSNIQALDAYSQFCHEVSVAIEEAVKDGYEPKGDDPIISNGLWYMTVSCDHELAKAIMVKTGGRWDKNTNGMHPQFTRKVGRREVELIVTSLRCERRAVGTRTVKREVPISTKIEEVEETVYETVCPPIMEVASDA